MPVTTLPDRRATSSVELHPLLAERWSPRGFDVTYELTELELTTVLEAARWAPSAANSQPWRFVVGRRGDATFAAIADLLAPGNQAWAPRASVLLIAIADTGEPDSPMAPWALYDTGQAVAHLSVQAQDLGLTVHQMGGFDAAGVRAEFSLGLGQTPIAVVALGRLDPDADLPEPFHERERAPRERRPLTELVLAG